MWRFLITDQEHAKSTGAMYVEVSAKTGRNVDLAFAALINRVLDQQQKKNNEKLQVDTPRKKKKICCVM